jgi:glycosyltransferase involved in cell wall biosynthesis
MHTPPRIVVSGRIAPSKFLLEIVAAMKLLWREHPHAELHVLGSVEARHADYSAALVQDIGDELNHRVFLHGAAFDAPSRVAEYDIALVLGEHQGCPNAVLEALAAGVPVAANDSGGTREQVIHERTGLLIDGTAPQAVASALQRLINNPEFAQRMAARGKRHVEKNFSMARMCRAYRKLFRV